MTSLVRSRLNRALAPHREQGQVIVIFAVFMIVLMVLAGSAYDYAQIVVSDARLQNAVDAAALAGADSLSRNAGLPGNTPVAIAEATAREYLRLNGVATATPGTNINFTFPTSTPVPSQTPSSVKENMQLTVTRNHQTFFWPLIGINSVNMQGSGGARAARAMTDIMLTLDTTASMYLAGFIADPPRNDFQALRDAVEAFINQVNPSTSDPRGPKIGIARFAGIKCAWKRNGAGSTADEDQYIDVRSSGDPNEYDTGCTDDYTVLTNLTNDGNVLRQIADASGGVSCPVSTTLACPLKHVAYTAPQVNGTPVAIGGIQASASATPAACALPNAAYSWYIPTACTPTYTGTKLPNGINAVSNAGYYAWTTANGGRNDELGEGNARKVLVMMTDGQNEAWPSVGPQANTGQWDVDFANRAAQLKLGPDGTAGTPDDVEIYTIGFFCTDPPGVGWCQSEVAATSAPHPCPGPVWPPSGVTPSDVDNLLRNASSSTPGTCDHYFPLDKEENLPQLFQALAGTISRGQLTN